jgi:hypothetical protein
MNEKKGRAGASGERRMRWRWGVFAALALALLALFPQVYLWAERGRAWQGANAYFYTDEPAYAAYVNALIDGRPRRSDPYTGEDATTGATLPESLFSIQFMPAYLVAWPARALGLSTATAFIMLAPLVAFLTALALFWLFALVMDDERAAAAFVPVVLCLGILLSGNGLVRALLDQPTAYVYLPFLRRYLPAAVFPFFVCFFPLAWLALNSAPRRRRLWCAVGAGACFTVCVYGYFYLWTTAAAWLALVALLWLVCKPEGWRAALASCALVGALGACALVPYALLLARRAGTMDTVQALVRTHAPDLWRSVEACALVVVCALGVGLWRGRLDWRDRRVLCAAAFALLPFMLFNQQVLTGRSLQPMHYEQFVTPYLTLIAAALTVVLLWRGRAEQRRLPTTLVLTVAALGFAWGCGETWIATRRFAAANVVRDEARAAALRLREIALRGYDDKTGASVSPHAVVFAPDIARADNLPMVAPQAVLWAPHMFVFSGVTVAENKERFFQYLYYSGVDADEFARDYWERGFVHYAIFGWERANPKLTSDFKPITREEIEVEQRNYAAYVVGFDRARAAHPQLAYLLVAADEPFDGQHLERWYTRDEGERLGPYVLYRLKLRP